MTPQLMGAAAPHILQTLPAVVLALFAAAALLLTWCAVRAGAGALRLLLRGRAGDDVLTLLAACVATGVSLTGMWRFFGDVLHFPVVLRILLCGFLELAVFACAVRAHRSSRTFGTAGADGVSVWVITSLSAVLSALDARSLPEALFRLASPLVAAYLWGRGMAIDRRRAAGRERRIHWRVTPERILVRLGLAESGERTSSEIDAQRRLLRVARAAQRVARLRATDAARWRIRRALARLDAATRAAIAHAGLATEQARQQLLLAQIGALQHAPALAEVKPTAPWQQPATDHLPSRRHSPIQLTPAAVSAAHQAAPRAQASMSVSSSRGGGSGKRASGRRGAARHLIQEASAIVKAGDSINPEQVLSQLRRMGAETSHLIRLAFIATWDGTETAEQAAELWPARARAWLTEHHIGFQRRELIRIRDERLVEAFGDEVHTAGGATAAASRR